MPLRSSARALLLRAAAALRRAGAALARRERGRPGQAPGPAASAEGHAFLDQVRGTLADISAGADGATPGPAPGADPTGPRSWRRRLGALLEPVRRHEDVVLAVALLVGIAVMILHWVR